MKDEQLVLEFQKIEDNFNDAVISNKVNEIKKCVTEDWVLVDTRAELYPRKDFLKFLKKAYFLTTQ
jgi:hypothetical protein